MVNISVCIPTYEQPDNLRKSLTSLVNQTYKNFEVIITDDSKSTNVKQVAELFQANLNIIYIKNSSTKGSPENWNECMRHARGKYIKILHHDDFLSDESSLESYLNTLENDINAAICFSSSRHVDNTGNYLSSHTLEESKLKKIYKDPTYLINGNVIGSPSACFFRKDIDIFFDGRMKWLVDIDFYITVLKKYKFTYTTDELICVNLGEESRLTYQCQDDYIINRYEHGIILGKLKNRRIPLYLYLYLIKFFYKFKVRKIIDIKEYFPSKYILDLYALIFISKLMNAVFKIKKIVSKY